MISIRINVEKIDKSALYKGEQGTYLTLTGIDSPNDKYGNSHFVVQDLGKERRLAGDKGEILGNVKPIVTGKEVPVQDIF